jgi:glycolate oxidase FAD binding subunit
LVGIPIYEPSELVLVALAGTPVAQIEQLLAENDQEFPFEPIDLGPVLGFGPGQATIGGVIATNLSGSKRILRGAARDHVLGVQAVNGSGEAIRAGGRVMKNVTGYDLGRALAGSWGTLAVMTEIAIKVLPAQREVRTVLCFGLADPNGVEALCLALGTPFEVSGTVHMHAELAEGFSDQEIANAGASVTAIRVENFPASARYRSSRLKQMLQAYAPALELDTMRSRIFWNEVRALKMFQKTDRPLWRISTLPSTAPKLVSGLARKIDVRVLYDWSGGLVWLETPPISDAGAVEIRRTIAEFGGHATLIRAEAQARAGIDVFQPLDPPLMALTASLKRAFDPVGILNPGRMYAGI